MLVPAVVLTTGPKPRKLTPSLRPSGATVSSNAASTLVVFSGGDFGIGLSCVFRLPTARDKIKKQERCQQ